MLTRDDGWKEYYNSEMELIEQIENESSIYDQLLEESEIEKLYTLEEYEKAATAMQKFIDKYAKDILEKGWYLQQLARYYYPISEYSCAVTPQIRQMGNHLSGNAGTAYASLLA